MHSVKSRQHQVVLASKKIFTISIVLFCLQGCGILQTQDNTNHSWSNAISFVNQLPPTSAGAPNLANWTASDISKSNITAGSTRVEENSIYVQGSGNNIWKHSDGFHYFHSPLVGNGDIAVKVNSIEYVHPWSKAGIMIRESLSPSSPYAMLLVTPDRGIALQYRSAEGEISYKAVHVEDVRAALWFKLTRIDNTIIAFRSDNGEDWSVVGAIDVTMSDDALIGLAVSSRHTNKLATAHFSDLSVSAASTQLSNAIEQTFVLTEQLIEAFSTTNTDDKLAQLEAALEDSQTIPNLVNTALEDLNTEIAAVEQRATLDALIADANALLATMSEQSSSETIAQVETLVITINTLAEDLNDSTYIALANDITSQVDTVKEEVAIYALNNDYSNMMSELDNLIANIEAGQTEFITQASALALSLSDLAETIGETDKITEAQSYIDNTEQLAAEIEEAERIAALNALLEEFAALKTDLNTLISSIQAGQHDLLPQATEDGAALVSLGASINTEKEAEAQALASTVTTLTTAHRRTTLSWDIPTERTNNENLSQEEISGYIIQYTIDGVQQDSITISSATTTSYVFENLDPGDYSFTVVTLDTQTLLSSPSEAAEKTVY